MLGAAAIVFAISLPVRPAGLATNFDPVSNVRDAVESARTLVDSGRRDQLIEFGHAAMEAEYGLAPEGVAAVGDHTVAIEPWEIGAAWAYELDWDPLPVFQNYSAYTPQLDRLNAEAVEDPDGPERLLRHNPLVVQPEFPTADLDDRFGGWDPPRTGARRALQLRAALGRRTLAGAPPGRGPLCGGTADRLGERRGGRSGEGPGARTRRSRLRPDPRRRASPASKRCRPSSSTPPPATRW